MVDGMPMSDERYKDIYNLVIQKCATHPLCPCHTCPVSKAFEVEKIRIEAAHHELSKQPCEVHKEEVSPTCRECLLWAARGGDLKTEKEIDFSVMEPDNKDLCRFLNEQVHFSTIRQNTDKLDKDWLTAMTEEEE